MDKLWDVFGEVVLEDGKVGGLVLIFGGEVLLCCFIRENNLFK